MIRLRVSNNAFTCFSVLGRKKSSNENQSLASRGEGLTFCRLNTRMPTHAIRTGAPDKRIGVDLAGILGDTWRAPMVGWCRVGWSMGRGVPFAADQGGLGERRQLPQRGPKTDFGVF